MVSFGKNKATKNAKYIRGCEIIGHLDEGNKEIYKNTAPEGKVRTL